MTTETSNARGDLLRPKLENIISGHRINADDADWLRGLLASAPPPAAARGDVRGLDRLGWVRRAAIERLRNDLDVTGVMVHDEERTDSVPVYLAAEGVQAGEVDQRARELLAQHCECGGGMQYTKTSDALRAIASALSQQPEARGVVDEAMVERALIADAREYGASIPESRARRLLAAALTGERNG